MIKANNEKRKTRQNVSNPFSVDTYYERLSKSNAILLKNNSIVTKYENGYSEITPKDREKIYKWLE